MTNEFSIEVETKVDWEFDLIVYAMAMVPDKRERLIHEAN